MGAADHPEADEGFDDVTAYSSQTPQVDRSHNRDTLSSEAMTEMLRDLQDALLAVDERLVAIESTQEGASDDTRQLARGVADMGGALARRVRALEQGRQYPPPILAKSETPPVRKPARQPPQRTLAWSVALLFILAVALAAFWLLSAESTDRAAVVVPSKPAVTAPAPTPTPTPTPPAADTTPTTQPTPSHAPSHAFKSPHHTTYARKPSVDTPPAAATTGYGHYGPSPSPSPPPPASAPSHSPS